MPTSPSQTGYELGGSWVSNTTMLATSSSGAGIRFVLPLSGNQTAMVYSSLSLGLTATVGSSVTLTAYLTTSTLSPGVFATANLPSAGGTSVGTLALTSGSTTSSITLDLATVTSYYRRAGWNGALNLSLFSSAGTITLTTSGLTTAGVPIDSGRSGFTYEDGDGALVRCAKCAGVDLYPRMVKDGFYKGLWVCQGCYDPEEPQRIPARPETPPDLGGA